MTPPDPPGAHDPTQAFPRVEPPRPARRVSPPATAATQRLVTPPAPVEPPPPIEPAPARRRGGRYALGALVVLLAVAAAVVVGTRSDRPTPDETGGVGTATPDAKHPPPLDVSLDRCAVQRDGVAVGGSVRNPTDDAADYVIAVQLVGPDGAQITAAEVPVAATPAHSRTTWSGAIPPVASDAPSGTCKLVRVDRYRAR